MRYQFDTLSARPMRDQPIRRFSSFFAAALTTIGLLISTPTIAADPVSKNPLTSPREKQQRQPSAPPVICPTAIV